MNQSKFQALVKRASSQDNKKAAEAQCILALCYLEGNGVVRRDLKRAAELFEAAANRGLVKAKCLLGKCYYYGVGVPQDEKKAAELLEAAAEQGYSDAQYALGLCYDKDGTDNIIENKLFRFFFKWCSSHGYISPTSYALHLIIPELFWSAAKQGHIQAQEAIVRFYKNISPDYIPLGILKAEELHRYFAMRGSAEQQYTLGLRYANGSNISKDEKGAADLLWCAAKRRHAPALDWLHQNQGQGQNAQLTAQPAAAAAATQPPNSVVGISTRLSY